MKTVCMIIVTAALVCSHAFPAAEPDVVLREDFDSLDGWRPLTFPKIERHSRYAAVVDGTNRVLRAASRASASGLIYTNTFNVARSPILKWRWKTDTVYAKGNALRKDGDDYPIRIYVVFKYDPRRAGLGTRAKYGLAKKLYGEYPPHSSLNYIWANRPQDKRILTSPYTGRSKMVVMRAGSKDVGRWVEEQVNILDDYRAAFGEDPPAEASLAVMSDSDNTGEAAVAYIDFIEIRGEGPQ
jgi:hypothetical protein